jgi:hypothetical protein
MTQIWAMQGKDTYENMREPMADIQGYIEAHGDSHVFTLGGDAMFASEVFGLGGHFSSGGCNCPFCTIKSTQLHEKKKESSATEHKHLCNASHLPAHDGDYPFSCPDCNKAFPDAAAVEADPPRPKKTAKVGLARWTAHWNEQHSNGWREPPTRMRTLARLSHAAHLPIDDADFPFSCPCCFKTFHDASAVASEEAPKDGAACKTHRATHESVTWHQQPLLAIEPSRFITCVLHDLLATTKALFKHAVGAYLTEETRKVMDNLFVYLGVYTGKFTSAPTGSTSGSARRPKSFTGAECKIVLENFAVILAIANPLPEQRDKIMLCINNYIAFRNVLTERCKPDGKFEKARKVQELAESYIDSYVSWLTKEKCFYYQHFALHHLADQIRFLPLDIVDCSGEGIERINQTIKGLSRHTNNNTKTHRRKSNGRGTQSAGPTYVRQMMKKVGIREERLARSAKSVYYRVRTQAVVKRERENKDRRAYVSQINLLPALGGAAQDHTTRQPS